MQKIEEKIIRTPKRYCDVPSCDARANNICEKCRRDLCTNHAIKDPCDYSDYPTNYCQHCFDIGKPFRKEINRVRATADEVEEKLEEQWRQACLKEGE